MKKRTALAVRFFFLFFALRWEFFAMADLRPCVFSSAILAAE